MKKIITLLVFLVFIGCSEDIVEQNNETDILSDDEILMPDANQDNITLTPIDGQYIVTMKSGSIPKGKAFKAFTAKKDQKELYAVENQKALNQFKFDKSLHLNLASEKITSAFNYALEGFVAKNVTAKELAQLKANPNVKSVEQDYRITLQSVGNVAESNLSIAAQETPWGITRIGGFGDGTGKTAWVIDSGIDLDHSDLNVDVARSVSYTGDNDPDDGNGHGTHVAGTIAAINNNTGVVGVAAGADVVSLKVLNNNGSGDFSWTVQALDYVKSVSNSGDVVNMSLGPNSRYIHNATDQATLSLAMDGIKIAIAAGNSYDDASFYSPAHNNHSNIYTISAIAEGDYWAYFSNYGTPVDYAAPGYGIKSTWLNGEYNTISGTSMASPHAAGVLLLGNPTSDGNVLPAYWELTIIWGRAYATGNYSGNNIYNISVYRYDEDGNDDPIIHR